MATADTARLIASLELKDKFSPTVNKAIGGLGRLDSRIDRTSSKAHQAGQHIGIGLQNAGKLAAIGIGAVASQVALGLRSLVKLEQAEAQTAAVLKSTGQAAGINGADVTRLAEKYEALNATVGDEFIRAGQNMLLTFTSIRGKAFEPALEAVLNLNTAMGKGPEGLTKTAILVGKALNDPAKGLTALTRVGVSFTKEQVKRIKGLQKEGKTYEAQKIILAELNKEFGGSFAAQGGTTAGKVAKFTDAIEDLQRSLAAGLLPVVSKVADRLSAFLADPTVIAGVEGLSVKIAGLFSDENLNEGAKVLRGLFQMAKDAAPTIAAAAKITGAALKVAVDTFRSLPPEIQKLLVAGLAVNKLTGGIVTNLAGGLISSVLKQLVSGVVNVNGGVVNVNGGGVGGAGAAGGVSTIKTVASLLAPAIAVAVASEFATNETNKGLGTTFTSPFAGGIGGNIVTGLNNLAEVLRVTDFGGDRGHEGGGTPPSRPRQQGLDPDARQIRNDKIAARIDISNRKIETLRQGIGADLSKVRIATLATGAQNVAASRAAGVASAVAAKNAGERSRGGGIEAAAAIRNKDLSVRVGVTTVIRPSIREQAHSNNRTTFTIN